MSTLKTTTSSENGRQTKTAFASPFKLSTFKFYSLFHKSILSFLFLSVTHLSNAATIKAPTTPSAGITITRTGSTTYATIQEAVNTSIEGDEVVIGAGSFTEQVTITKSITLRGAGKDETTIKSPLSANLVQTGTNWKTLKNQMVFAVVGIKAATNALVTIKDLTIDGDNQGYLSIEDKSTYTFQGIGVYDSNVTIENVLITQVRELATDYNTNQADPSNTAPEGYFPTDQPAGFNHNESIGAEGTAGATEDHTLTVKNCEINKFQKTGILAWGPKLIVDINNNKIQGYYKTLWSTGNGIQIASSLLGSGDRRGTKGSITDNQILGIGLVIPSPGNPGSYNDVGILGSTGLLCWEAGDDLVISGNTITGSDIYSWRNDITSEGGYYANQGIVLYNTKNATVEDNTISGFDAGIAEESAVTGSSTDVKNNQLSRNGIDIVLHEADDVIKLSAGSNPETIASRKGKHGIDLITGFGDGDRIYVFDNPTGTVNGILDGEPVIDFTDGTVTSGDGTTVGAHSVQVEVGAGKTTLHINTGDAEGAADLKIELTGTTYDINNFLLYKGYIYYVCSGKWLGAVSSDWNNTANWGCATIPTSTTNVIIPEGTTFFPKVNVSDATCNNLTVFKAATMWILTGQRLDIKGDFTNDGTFFSAGLAEFSGVSQTIPRGVFQSLKVSGTGEVILGGDVTVSDALTLGSNVQLGVYDMTLTSEAIVTGASASAFLITNSTGKVKRENMGATDGGSNAPFIFPIGSSAASYTPVTVQNGGTTDAYAARVISGINSSYTGETPGGTSLTRYNVNKTWFVTEETPGESDAILVFQWNADDVQPDFQPSNCFASHYVNGAWKAGTADDVSGPGPYSISLTGVETFSPFGVGSTGSALPLTLLSFTAKASENQAVLSWETVNEVNVAGFEIEESSDAKHFTKIGYQEALQSDKDAKRSYQFFAQRPISNGTWYYRLKMLDMDGTFSYSKKQSVRFQDKESDFELFPNPVSGNQISIRSNIKGGKSLHVSITDPSGRNFHQSVSMGSNDGYYSIPVKSLSPGRIYLLHLTELPNGRRQMLRFVR